MKTTLKNQTHWQREASQHMESLLALVQKIQPLQKKGPAFPWKADIEIVSSSRIQSLNQHYRQKNQVTDVLSFTAPSSFWEQGWLGTVIICLPRLSAQAKIFKHSPECELMVLLIHGVLHLLGFDHEQGDCQFTEMAQWESTLLKRMLASQKRGSLLSLCRRQAGRS